MEYCTNRQNHLKLHPLERTRQQLGFDLQQPVLCTASHITVPVWLIFWLDSWAGKQKPMMVRGVNGAIASIVLLLLENHRREFHISIKKELFIKAQNLVPQHQLSRVVGKVAASENPVVKNAVIHAFKS